MRWEISRIVAEPKRCSSAARIFASVSVSTAESESSKMRIGVCCVSARAIAARCFCPPESVTPRSPTKVSYPLAKLSTVSSRQAARLASRTVSIVMASSVIAMFSRIVRLKRYGSCSTMPMFRRRCAVSISFKSTPPIVMRPWPSARG